MKFIAEGSLTEDDIVNQIGDAALGSTSQHYRPRTQSPEQELCGCFQESQLGGMRPNLVAMQSYDGMHLMDEALKKTKRLTAVIVAAMKGRAAAPRGPITIDPATC